MQGGGTTATDAGRRGDAAIRDLFQRMARALTTGNAVGVAALWATPAFLIGPDGAQAVGSNEELAEIFSGAKDHYNARGVVNTRAQITDLRWATERIAIVEVRWPWLDEQGREVGEETSTYTISREGAEGFKLRAAVMHGAVTKH